MPDLRNLAVVSDGRHVPVVVGKRPPEFSFEAGTVVRTAVRDDHDGQPFRHRLLFEHPLEERHGGDLVAGPHDEQGDRLREVERSSRVLAVEQLEDFAGTVSPLANHAGMVAGRIAHVVLSPL